MLQTLAFIGGASRQVWGRKHLLSAAGGQVGWFGEERQSPCGCAAVGSSCMRGTTAGRSQEDSCRRQLMQEKDARTAAGKGRGGSSAGMEEQQNRGRETSCRTLASSRLECQLQQESNGWGSMQQEWTSTCCRKKQHAAGIEEKLSREGAACSRRETELQQFGVFSAEMAAAAGGNHGSSSRRRTSGLVGGTSR